MKISYETIYCQDPQNQNYIDAHRVVIRCSVKKTSAEYNTYLETAKQLALKVNPAAANYSDVSRGSTRKQQDAFGGVLAEQGWLKYINNTFGDIASPTPFMEANGQIDIKLSQGQTIEVRSSFPRNGVKFAVCHSYHNFKNIGPYSNSVKPGEVQKNFYACVLFETNKEQILDEDEIVFYLIGGSTWEMMMTKGQDLNLQAEGVFSNVRSTYRVVYVKDALDITEFEKTMIQLGYNRI